MNINRGTAAIPAVLMLAACGAGTPATVDEATEKLRESFDKDDYSVTWINVVPKDKPGEFLAMIDRNKKDDPDDNETKMCNASISSNSSSWTCKAFTPSIMTQAANLLIKDYNSRKVEVSAWHLQRTGKGNDFSGYFELVAPGTTKAVRIPCKGTQEKDDYDINCDFAYGEEGKSGT